MPKGSLSRAVAVAAVLVAAVPAAALAAPGGSPGGPPDAPLGGPPAHAAAGEHAHGPDRGGVNTAGGGVGQLPPLPEAVEEPVQEVVGVVDETVDPVTDPVTDVTDPVTDVTDPVTDPVVDVVDDALDTTDEVVDTVTGGSGLPVAPAPQTPTLEPTVPQPAPAEEAAPADTTATTTEAPADTTADGAPTPAAGGQAAVPSVPFLDSDPAPASTPAAPTRPEPVVRPTRTDVGVLANQAGNYGFPIVLSVLVVAYLLVQGRVDRRDPKLAAAPVDRRSDLVRFR